MLSPSLKNNPHLAWCYGREYISSLVTHGGGQWPIMCTLRCMWCGDAMISVLAWDLRRPEFTLHLPAVPLSGSDHGQVVHACFSHQAV